MNEQIKENLLRDYWILLKRHNLVSVDWFLHRVTTQEAIDRQAELASKMADLREKLDALTDDQT